MTTRGFHEFAGLDVRRAAALSDQRTARVATNVYLTSGRVWRTRPGSERVAQLPPETKGLFSAGGVLRTVAPAGYADIYNQQTPLVWMDFIGDGLYDRDDIEAVTGYEPFGGSLAAGIQPYVALKRLSTGRVEHHYVSVRPAAPGATVATKVVTPFDPGEAIIRLADKVWAVANAVGSVPFSSTEFGPTDWVTTGDAGALPVLQHAPGGRVITGFGWFRNQLVVFFEDAIQLWEIDPDPANHTFVELLNGPGTLDPRLIQNTMGDVVFFSRGGFRSLSTQKITGEMTEGDVGAPIYDLTAGLSQQGTAAVWWSKLGCYLAAFGQDVYAFKMDPLNKVTGWSKWRMPVEVTDFALRGDALYYRGANDAVYRFDEDLDTDDGAPIAFDLTLQYLHLDRPGVFKVFNSLIVYQDGEAAVSYLPDATDPAFEVPIYSAFGVTRPHQKIPLLATADSVSLRFNGTGRWQLDGFTVDYSLTGV